ncbi:GlsB/YeaQ/YmgE family stress response membrane protein [Actinokineospora inagensis]|uniref:GlsB/YeaQ/YmgE family stress response membrane protein n=1 Tax=Actinokineospora inagensis TaxID=103730 RepID=UPI00040A28A1|nr:GlsB/YeaQ/YmgE family stress response membrane protein [Actinokineospora inagensis]
MSQEGGSERTQRTVAELLAKYGGAAGEGAPRRRRRKPDDASDTAPQAIIDRVMSDSGTMLPIRDDQDQPERTSHRQGRQADRPAAPQPHQPPQAPQPSQQVPLPGRRARPEPVEPRRRPPVDQQPLTEQHPPVAPPMTRPEPPRRAEPPRQPEPPRQGRPVEPFPNRPVDPAPQPFPPEQAPVAARPPQGPATEQRPPVARPRPEAVEPHTEQLPRVPAEDAPEQAEPPAAQAMSPNRAPLLPRRAPVPGRRPGPQPGQQGPQPSQPLPVPPGPPQPSQPLPVPPRRPGFPGGEFPGDSSETAVDPNGPPPEFHDEYEGFDDKAATRFTEYEAHDNFADTVDDEHLDADDDYDGPVEDRVAGLADEDEYDEDAAEREPRSAGREWLIMIGQLGLAVVGGAVVWLLFNWLWRVLPAAALIGALAVIVGLVLIVRKVRRAEDLQTTVLAVLVGLLATVSPAALLLLDR